MPSDLWKKAFEKLKFPDNDNQHSPATFENSNQTNSTSQGAEMNADERNDEVNKELQIEEENACVLADERNDEVNEEFQIREENACVLAYERNDEVNKELQIGKGKPSVLAYERNDEVNEEFQFGEEGACWSDPKSIGYYKKTLGKNNADRAYCNKIDQNVSDEEGENSKRLPKKKLTPREIHLLKISEKRGQFRRVNPVRNNDFNRSELNSSLDNDDRRYEVNTPLTGLVTVKRYTQADRMAAHPIILTEVWDDEEIW